MIFEARFGFLMKFCVDLVPDMLSFSTFVEKKESNITIG